MSRIIQFITSALVAASIIAAAAACGDGSDGPAGTTSTPGLQATSAATPTTTSPSPFATAFSGPNEGGQAPVFYRTADNFASVVAGQPYKVLFRITNGYAEPALNVTATCTSCPSSPTPQALSGVMVQPVGEEAPGSFYPTNLLLPVEGHWELTVHAGADQVTIPVDVQPAP